MPLDVDLFKAKFADGGARPSLFEMTIDSPLRLNFQLAPFVIRVSEIPGSTITPIVQKFAGREIKFAGQRTFTNLTVTVLNDEGFTIRSEMERWVDSINSRVANVRTTGDNEGGYRGNANVRQFNKIGAPTQEFRFVDIFPVAVAPIPLDWGNDGVIEEYTVEFAYNYWEPIVASRGLVNVTVTTPVGGGTVGA